MNLEERDSVLHFGLLLIVGGSILWFWIKAFYEAVTEESAENRIIWSLIVFFGGPFGAMCYSFFRVPARRGEEACKDRKLLEEMRDELTKRP